MMIRNKYKKYPFLILLTFHTVLLLYTFYKSKDRKRLFILLISNIGIAYLFEYFVHNIFDGYRYKPSFIKDSHLDSIFGAILSQAIYVPFTALSITTFQLGIKSKVLVSLYFALIEALFVRMGIYTQKWWKTVYTFILLPVFFTISDKWYKYLKKENPFVLFISLYHLILIPCVNVLFLRAVRGNVKFGIGSFHSWREHFILVPLYAILLCLITAWAVRVNTSLAKILSLSFRVVVDFVLVRVNWLKGGNKQVLINFPLHLVLTFMSGYFGDLVYKEKRK